MSDRKNRPILCLDFDGVCHSYVSGWKGAANIPDDYVPGLFEFLEAVKDDFDVQVFSSRSHQEGGVEAMTFWFVEQRKLWRARGGEPPIDTPLTLSFPKEKPAAMVSIDDRCLLFTGEWPSLEKLKTFQPWNKKEHSPDFDRGLVIDLIAKAIKKRLQEAVVDEIILKPSIAELEARIKESEGNGGDNNIGTLLPDGSLVVSHTNPVFAPDLADAAIGAIYDAGFRILPK